MLEKHDRKPKPARLDVEAVERHVEVQKSRLDMKDWTLKFCKVSNCTSQQKVDTTLYFYTSFNEHNTPYTVLESDNSESMPDVLH